MVTEKVETKKKPMDYTASAVALLNPNEVQEALCELNYLNKEVEKTQDIISALIPREFTETLTNLIKKREEVTQKIKDRVNTLGSYQNLDAGWYAVKQRKLSKSYDAAPFEQKYPQFAPAVIIKAVDTTKLNGLIKGGLLDEAQLEADGVLKISESFAYIIKV